MKPYPHSSLPKCVKYLSLLPSPNSEDYISLSTATINMGISRTNGAVMRDLLNSCQHFGLAAHNSQSMRLTKLGVALIQPYPLLKDVRKAAYNPIVFNWIHQLLKTDVHRIRRKQVLELVCTLLYTPFNEQHCTTSYYQTVLFVQQNELRTRIEVQPTLL